MTQSWPAYLLVSWPSFNRDFIRDDSQIVTTSRLSTPFGPERGNLQSGLVGSPARFFGNHFSRALANRQHGQHGVDARHQREDAGVGDADILQSADLQLRVDDRERVAGHIAHLGGTSRVVDGVGNATTVFGELLVGLDLRSRRDFALDPVLERSLLGDFTSRLETGYDSGGIVALGIGEVAEVQSRLHAGILRGQVEAAAGASTGDVRGHAESIDRGVVSQAGSVEAERDLVAVHHEIRDLAIRAGRVGDFAAQEDAAVRVHGGLVRGNGAVEFPDDDTLGVVDEILPDTGDVLDHGDSERAQLLAGSQSGVQHQSGGVDGSSTEDGLLLGLEGMLDTRLQSDIDTGHSVSADVDAGDPGVGQDSQVRALLLPAQDRVDVSDTSAVATAVVGVIRDGEETNTLGQSAPATDLLVEVGDNGDVHGGGARLNPVLAELVPVALVDGLERVAQIVNNTGEGLERPTFAARFLPQAGIVLEGSERDEGVVAGAATEDLGARVTDITVACRQLEISSPREDN